jgi:hypothetical protein
VTTSDGLRDDQEAHDAHANLLAVAAEIVRGQWIGGDDDFDRLDPYRIRWAQTIKKNADALRPVPTSDGLLDDREALARVIHDAFWDGEEHGHLDTEFVGTRWARVADAVTKYLTPS